MRLRVCWLLLLAMLTVGALGAVAQDEAPPPVLAVLASVPDTPEARQTLSYADYAALTGGRASEQAWMDTLTSSLYSGPDLSYFADRVRDQESLIGVSLFDVAQAATWGQPPPQVTLLQGVMDPAAIEAAYAARGYSVSPAGDFTLFCAPAGCDEGMSLDIDSRNPGDPFGGEIGRAQPVLFASGAAGGQLISSPVLDALGASTAAAAGDDPSLADSPDIQAAVHAVTGDGTLLQAYFLTGESFGPSPDAADTLPAYGLAVLAETDTPDGRIATVTLVYPALADAEVAAEALEARMESIPSVRRDEPITATLKDLGMLFSVTATEDASTGLGVAQVAFRAPEGEYTAYRLLAQLFMGRDLGWLAIE